MIILAGYSHTLQWSGMQRIIEVNRLIVMGVNFRD